MPDPYSAQPGCNTIVLYQLMSPTPKTRQSASCSFILDPLSYSRPFSPVNFLRVSSDSSVVLASGGTNRRRIRMAWDQGQNIMPLIQLVYASAATKPFTQTELRELLSRARANNSKEGIT